jgi:hypothetical protein
MTKGRLPSIYGTIKLVILESPSDKSGVYNQLLCSATEWDTQCSTLLTDQATFDKWFWKQVNRLLEVPFSWTQKRRKGEAIGRGHDYLSFGAAQKFLNLTLKDWWAISPKARELDRCCCYLHAPLDDITAPFVARALRWEKQDMVQSIVYDLDHDSYQRYQAGLQCLANDLHCLLGVTPKPRRIDVEQLIWGWICDPRPAVELGAPANAAPRPPRRRRAGAGEVPRARGRRPLRQ